ncbi:PREDICTED: uncharacterized protein LOC106816029 [Priapulus caudatus]|uniref:Uncharacterized protein LOC106816029 n=1 Tax=Priapulus caudatus TaxID=37621 RepID=A0ABM1EV41_PRICU|nr:PREDICTED: uncharacterized protein LOC106816029 [Priapulus caudatus]
MMKILLIAASLYVALAGPVEKRFGVPLTAELECLNGANFSTDANDCQIFYICDHLWPKIRRCAADTIWSPRDQRCMGKFSASNEICGYRAPQPLLPPGLEELSNIGLDQQWECRETGELIPYKGVCDGIVHCLDESDEQGCAAFCDANSCRLPDCKCADTQIPGGLVANDIPQMVLIGWDEALRVEDYNHLYQQIFKRVTPNRRREPRRNPNGCPITGTFFVSHQFTDYAAVQSMYAEGNEIAAHSISKQLPAAYWEKADANELQAEYANQRIQFSQLASVPPSRIVGMRAAYLQTSGDTTVDFAQNAGFAWDSSYPTPRMSPPLWPYTFDYKTFDQTADGDCPVPPCPTAPHRGFWEFPLVDWIDTNDTLCANVDSCYFPEDKDEALQLLRSNFARHYETNRAPFPLNLRARWFLDDGQHNMEALQEFMDDLAGRDDIYFVTYSQALEWMRDPVRLADLGRSTLFSCDYADRAPLCAHPNLCGYLNITHAPNDDEHPGDRFFQTCARCPDSYPWVDNPTGE